MKCEKYFGGSLRISFIVKHPLFNEWSIGGSKPSPNEEPRKKRRQISRSAGTSAVPLPSATNRQTSAASLHPGTKKKSSAMPASHISTTSSTASSAASQPTHPSQQKKHSLDIASLLSRPQDDESSYPAASTFFSESQATSKQTDPYSSYYQPPHESRQDFFRAPTQEQTQQTQQQQSQQQQPQLYPPYHHKRMMIEKYRYPPGAEPTHSSESLDQQLHRYREQYRQLNPPPKRSESDPFAAYPPRPQDYPSAPPSKIQQQNNKHTSSTDSHNGTTSKEGYESGEEQVFPFMNCLQELMKVTNDLKPSSVVVKEEVVCVDSLEGGGGKGSKDGSKTSAGKHAGLSASFAAPPGRSSSPPTPAPHYRSASFPSFPSVNAPPPPHLPHLHPPQPAQGGYYYPSHSQPPSSFTQGLGLSDDHPSTHPMKSGSSYHHPYSEERRSAWDFSSGPGPGTSQVFDTRPMSHMSSSPYSGIHLPPSPAQSSTLLRLLSYDN